MSRLAIGSKARVEGRLGDECWLRRGLMHKMKKIEGDRREGDMKLLEKARRG